MRAWLVYSFPCARAYQARRALRGGSYWNNARNCRSAYRNENDPDDRNDNIGFRLAAAHPWAEPVADPVLAACGLVRGRPPCLWVLVGGQKSLRTLPEVHALFAKRLGFFIQFISPPVSLPRLP